MQWISLVTALALIVGLSACAGVKAGAGEAAKPSATPQTAVIETDRGTIEFEFFPKEAPKTVANFIQLAQKGFYNGLTFHRVEPGFVVQGGDPKGDGTGGPGYNIPAEFNEHPHVTGAVAMARAQDPNSAGSQFYICLAPASFLDRNYTVFGQVTRGQDVVAKIRRGDVMRTVSIR